MKSTSSRIALAAILGFCLLLPAQAVAQYDHQSGLPDLQRFKEMLADAPNPPEPRAVEAGGAGLGGDIVLAETRSRCTEATPEDSGIYSPDVDERYLTAAELDEIFPDMYANSKRARNRVYYDPSRNGFVTKMPHPVTTGGKYVLETRIANVPIRFLRNMIRHIEAALRNDYAEHILPSDMGHAHFFLPNEEEESREKMDNAPALEAALGDPRTKFLYHTAEEILTSLDDPDLRRRFLNRNIVGDNIAGGIEIHSAWDGGSYNTVREIDGYFESPRLITYFRANKDGCFPYKKDGRTYYFDIRL